jgi:hypothetical protein
MAPSHALATRKRCSSQAVRSILPAAEVVLTVVAVFGAAASKNAPLRRRTAALRHPACYGALAMCMIGCAGQPTPSKIRVYHTLVAAPRGPS